MFRASEIYIWPKLCVCIFPYAMCAIIRTEWQHTIEEFDAVTADCTPNMQFYNELQRTVHCTAGCVFEER